MDILTKKVTGSHVPKHPPLGHFAMHGLVIAEINLHADFELSNFAHSQDMAGPRI